MKKYAGAAWNGKVINIVDGKYNIKKGHLAYWHFKQELCLLEDVRVNFSDPNATFMVSSG